MTSPTVAVIIPYFKAPEALARCTAALRTNSYANIELFVRDNSDDNVFYTRAINEGLAKHILNPAVGYALVLNHDAVVYPDMLSVLVEHMETHPRCGIACPLQMNNDGLAVSWGGSLDAFPWGRHRADPLASYTGPFETYWANGAAMLLRMTMLREIGLLDANMRFICSDADISFTARARGWRVAVVPTARVTHRFSGSRDAQPNEINFVKFQDAQYFAKKWISGDLYRSLAFEGPGLTPEVIKDHMVRYQRTLDVYVRDAELSQLPEVVRARGSKG